MSLQVIQHRKLLTRTLKALQNKQLTIGFIGGSITDPRKGTNWPESVIRWFAEHYPEVRLTIENTAIGATGSTLAVFRAQKDLVDRCCDLVFIEFAVNDLQVATDLRSRTREGLVRKLLRDEARDLVLVYTYSQPMYKDIAEGRIPSSIDEFEQIAEHYQLGSVWAGLYAINEVRLGIMRWDDWLPDGLHPGSRGSVSYGRSVISYLESELTPLGAVAHKDTVDKVEVERMEETARDRTLPKPLYPQNWEMAEPLPFSEVQLTGPWTLRRWPYLRWIDQVLYTSAVGAKLSFSFEGTGLALGFDFGKLSSEFRYRIDMGEWHESSRERPDWCGDQGWYQMQVIADGLDWGKHQCEMEVIHGDRPECKGTEFNLACIGLLK
ncbi:SGNH/GDSL hydrolase family protein [Paenibacillus agricola]|uniref:SGNH/GDSL hydrolase family protein n=1 Tax=Paenibacillus agricola TaxID=2716264 RepID=A0ABX0J4K4_9BACL|nr:SGNH/GDSL hydrolase family protein [Paenibacillus agricola]NHN31067.1 SGNH/GDSL hydrolase family protein [Paenibacillus agricola]